MQKYKINNCTGYLSKDLHLKKEDIENLSAKNLALPLDKTKQMKYKSEYLILEEGLLFLKLNDKDIRYSFLKKYLLLRDNMAFMNSDYLEDIDKIYPIVDERVENDIVFYEGQIYDLDSFFKKIVVNADYEIVKQEQNYDILYKDKIIFHLCYNQGVYQVKKER